MSATISVNGYEIKPDASSQWCVFSASGENVAGPFSSQQAAAEVASVFQDQPEPAARRGKK
ncbi:hypothetical protein CJU73_15845 [Pseudomonas fragi]|uniref:hypothetical protein n=1 Tax=Pseudomonas fragi TaxID=296 RepID=UPI000BA2B8CC|nr:hypothetical protein [Pseudomonas fragi]PAA27428.1 hypothetical protein CJU73_15845 [Pseudomonas fragi]